MKPLLPLLICSAATTALLGGCWRDRTVYVHDQPGQVQPAPVVEEEVVVADAPPPMQTEVIVASPGPDFLWIGGSWEWHDRWVWSAGRWDRRPYGGARWYAGSHRFEHGRHSYTRGHWGR